MVNNNISLNNFKEVTGTRFRVSKNQSARIALTKLGDDRSKVAGPSTDAHIMFAANLMDAVNKNGNPLNWVEEAVMIMNSGWDPDMELTREEAFNAFISSTDVSGLRSRVVPEIPDSVYLSEGLTLDNFSDRVKEATGVARRFRVSREQAIRIKDGTLTREDALLETIKEKTSNVVS